MFNEDLAVVVPVYIPEPGLKGLCTSLLELTPYVIVVDDGSNRDCEKFGEIPSDVRILCHVQNRGKGRAIKTGISWVKENLPHVKVIVFADGDGQHRLEDIEKTARNAMATGNVTLGVRDFSKANIPLRSRFGNVLTSFFVRHIFKLTIYDTQTGLRAIPSRLFDAMLSTPGERYEYEMRLFGMLRDHKEHLEQVPIETIYIENNRASHFHPIKDSIRVYRGLFGGMFIKFGLSSLLGFLVDNVVFTIVLLSLQAQGILRRYDILISLIVARIVSATINYACNRALVFRSRAGVAVSFSKYWALVLLIAVLSYVGTASFAALFDALGVNITGIKILVETVLFVLSYHLQKRWVFKNEKWEFKFKEAKE